MVIWKIKEPNYAGFYIQTISGQNFPQTVTLNKIVMYLQSTTGSLIEKSGVLVVLSVEK